MDVGESLRYSPNSGDRMCRYRPKPKLFLIAWLKISNRKELISLPEQ
jgi:hypothetical protein